MKKEFVWQDLRLHYEWLEGGRTKHALQRLLAGETVDLSEYPAAPHKIAKHRTVYKFCKQMKRLLKGHEGVEIIGDVVRIPELQKPKSFLRDV